MMITANRVALASVADPVLNAIVEEIASRLQAGDEVDLEAIARRVPERADLLRQLLPSIRMMAKLGRSIVRDAARAESSEAGPEALGMLGDYRILREIGRGGMGVVYEAEQVSLGRRVALKVLPLAAATDPKQLVRFQIEAQAAAQLHHANIVLVYGVGCERSLNFYAMQRIDGPSLAAVIRELRRRDGAVAVVQPGEAAMVSVMAGDLAEGRFESARSEDATQPRDPQPHGPTAGLPPPSQPATTPKTQSQGRAYFRAVAHLGIQAAEALDYAHRMGIVHRDIKPANLLVDVRGNLWITDFGLARMQEGSDLTMTGDLLGTLRYMSPEQALAQRIVVDYRTDIYSLGATLYELLTLRPAFNGDGRQEVLRQIASEEPRPPRRIDPAIPRELETIVQKAMAKEPKGRYATAQDLAADLCRFLDDQPIRAKPPTLLERATKWAWRHQAATAAAFTILAVAVVALSVSTALIVREQKRTAAAAQQSYYESLMQRLLQLRLTAHSNGWSDKALDLIRQAVRLHQDDGALKDQAASTLIGMDAHLHKQLPTRAATLVFDPGGQRLLMSDRQGGFTIWDSATDEIKDQDSAMDGPIRIAFRGDGTPLQLGPTRGTESARPCLRLRDGARQQIMRTFAIPGDGRTQLLAYALSPEGTLVGAVSGAADGEPMLTVWGAASGRVLQSIPSRADGLAFSPDASLLAAWDGDGTITVWSLPEGGPVATLTSGHAPIRCVAFRRDIHRRHGQGSARSGWLLAAGDAGGTVTVWDLRSKLPVT